VHKDIAILYLPDVISICMSIHVDPLLGTWLTMFRGQNSKLMADQFAANGYYTLIPDLFNGDPVSLNMPEGFDFMAWLTTGSDGKNPHTVPFVDKIVEASIKYLQEEKKMIKIGAVGYCFVRKCCLKLSGLQY
jgi:dienelactone hydrolase